MILNSSVCYFCGDKYNQFLSEKTTGGNNFQRNDNFSGKTAYAPLFSVSPSARLRFPKPQPVLPLGASAASASSASPCRPNHPRLEYKKSCLTFHNGRQPHRTYIEMKKLFALVFTCKGSDTKNTHQIFSKKNCIFPKKMLETTQVVVARKNG